jgi:enoyl-CoA hydratase/3-hydroxyacyl-CoA dehydrogenase
MDAADIETVAVIGAGSMGHGIAEVVAMAGCEVILRDVEQELAEEGYEAIRWSLEKLAEDDRLGEPPEAVLERVSTAVELEAAVGDADLVIEAAPERMELKRELFAELDEHAPERAILATNTSSLSITEIAAATDRPERVVGTHYFNPPVKMDLIEVIYGEHTSDATAETAHGFAQRQGKTPIYVRKDVRGFVVNNVIGPFGYEPAWMVSAGEATVRQADAAMVHERGYPMGPFELMDMTGIDIGYSVRVEAGDPIPPVVQERIDAGELGRKTGRGYYEYDDGPGPDYEPADAEGFDWLRVEARMANAAARLVGDGVATPEAIDTGVRLGGGFPEGICRRADDIGLERVLEKLRACREATGAERYEPAAHLLELVEAGDTGREAGAGFHNYGEGSQRSYAHIQYTHEDGLLAVTIDRPERLNALNAGVREELLHLIETTDEDEVRCLTIEGAGDRAFCAGADIGDLARAKPTDVMGLSELHEAVADYPRPTLAKIDGFCLGGGNELALACDMRVATERSEFGQPEIRLGLIPGAGGTQRLLREVGRARAKELVFRGNRIDAETAADWGLINRAVPAEAFEDTVDAYLEDLLSGPPVALEVAKTVMDDGADADLDAALRMESQGFGLVVGTEDASEGIAAFREDREPEFTGE